MASKKTAPSTEIDKARKPKAQDPPAALAADEDEPLYTLPALVDRCGKATEEEALLYVEDVTKAELTDWGRSVATPRIDKDTARLYGIAADFAKRATGEELEAMPAFSESLLRIAIWAAHQGSQKAEAREAGKSKAGSTKEARQTDAATLRSQGLLQRTQMAAALRPLSGSDRKLLAKIDEAAFGTAVAAKDLADCLVKLVGVGRAILDNPSETMKARLQGTRLTKDRLTKLETLAANIRQAGDAAAAPIAAPTSQADVDYWDGINLYLLDYLVDMFEAGHEAIPTIPRLVPISLRGVLRKRSSAKPPTPTGGASSGSGTPT